MTHVALRWVVLAPAAPPASHPLVPHVVALVEELVARGHEVHVLTADGARPARPGATDRSMRLPDSVALTTLDLPRWDLETNVRAFSRQRADDPGRWSRRRSRRLSRSFPDSMFGEWAEPMRRRLLELHERTPFDVVHVVGPPFATVDAAFQLSMIRQVPYVLDARSAWTFDDVTGAPRESLSEARRSVEQNAVAGALSIWCSQGTLERAYLSAHPAATGRTSVVADGWPDSRGVVDRSRAPTGPLRFLSLGRATVAPSVLRELFVAWADARRQEEDLRGAVWHIGQRVGSGRSWESNGQMEAVLEASADGVEYVGPIPAGEAREAVEQHDVVVLVASSRLAHVPEAPLVLGAARTVAMALPEGHDLAHARPSDPSWLLGRGVQSAADGFAAAARLATRRRTLSGSGDEASRGSAGPALGVAVADVERAVLAARS